MQTTGAQSAAAPSLARDLNDLMDRYFEQPIMSISNSPDGALDDGLPIDREGVGPLTIGDEKVDVALVRVEDPQSGPIWLISSATLTQVPALHQSIGETLVDRIMPRKLVRRGQLVAE
jgi:MscS family membrane protein